MESMRLADKRKYVIDVARGKIGKKILGLLNLP